MEHLYSLLETLNAKKNVDVVKQSGVKEISVMLRNPIVIENIQLLDLEGERNKPKFKQSKNYLKIDVSSCRPGIFLLKIFSEQGVECYKISKN